MPLSILIIGGSDAGISAALRAHELDASARITVVLADAFPNFSICGLPFFLSGETPDWKHLAHRTEFPGIEILTNRLATSIDPKNKTVSIREKEGLAKFLNYDKLIIGTGATPVRPPIHGLDTPGVYPLHTMDDSFLVHDHLTNKNPKSAVIVGAGYIGLEMADALVHRGLEVTLISRPSEVLSTVDPELGQLVRKELDRNAVRVLCGREIQSISELQDGKLCVAIRENLKRRPILCLLGWVFDRPRNSPKAPASKLVIREPFGSTERWRLVCQTFTLPAIVLRPGIASLQIGVPAFGNNFAQAGPCSR